MSDYIAPDPDSPYFVEGVVEELNLKNPQQLDYLIRIGKFPKPDGYVGAKRIWRRRTLVAGREAMITNESTKPPGPKPPPKKAKRGL